MNAEQIARALGGKRVGQGWMARCPVHRDSTPSLSIKDAGQGTVLVHCFAGCRQEHVIAFLRSQGLWSTARVDARTPLQKGLNRPLLFGVDEERSAVALALWQSAVPADGTLVETYLASRGLALPQATTVRFHPDLLHPSGETHPAMVGLVTRGVDGKPLGVHRTFLTRDGKAKAPVENSKMMLGPCRAGAVRLAEASDTLMVGEGIETCLAAMQSGDKPAWAALSTAGLRTLDLPLGIREVTVLADGDMSGEQAAQEAAKRWMRQGRTVRIARAPTGQDFNDLLLELPLDEEIQP